MTGNLEFVDGRGSLMVSDLPINGEVYTISQRCSLKMNMSSNEPEISELSTQFAGNI